MDTREWFAIATVGFERVLDKIAPEHLLQPGLGEWDVRSLLGHTTRSYLTLKSYLGATPVPLVLDSPTAYYRAAATQLADPAQVAQRGRDAGAALGEDPVAAARVLIAEVLALVAKSPDEASVATPLGGMSLRDYLPTRAFEITVHGMDLARAVGQPSPEELVAAAGPALALAASLADANQTVELLLAATGREPLSAGFSVL